MIIKLFTLFGPWNFQKYTENEPMFLSLDRALDNFNYVGLRYSIPPWLLCISQHTQQNFSAFWMYPHTAVGHLPFWVYEYTITFIEWLHLHMTSHTVDSLQTIFNTPTKFKPLPPVTATCNNGLSLILAPQCDIHMDQFSLFLLTWQ